MGKQAGIAPKSSSKSLADYLARECEDDLPDPFPHSMRRLAELMTEREAAIARVYAEGVYLEELAIYFTFGRPIKTHPWPDVCTNVDRLRKVLEFRGLIWRASTLADEIERLEQNRQKNAGELAVDEFTDAWLAMATNAANTSQGDELTLEARSLAMLALHPDWTVTRIAKSLKCDRKHLHRLPKFAAANKIRRSHDLPHGTKSSEGHIEAWDSEGGE